MNKHASQHLDFPLLLGQSGHEHLTNFKFVLEATWAACRLCGAVYQSELDRKTYSERPFADINEVARAYELRQLWRLNHEVRNHTQKEIDDLAASHLTFTPEAAGVLSSFGIIPMKDAGSEVEVDQALFEAPRAPFNDAEE